MNAQQKHLGHGVALRALAATTALGAVATATVLAGTAATTASAAAPVTTSSADNVVTTSTRPAVHAAATKATLTAARTRGITRSTMGLGTLRLRYVTVTTSLGPNNRTLKNTDSVYVKVCVRTLPPGYAKGLPVSSAVWSERVFMPVIALPQRTGKTPALKRTVLHRGQCAAGYVNFDTTKLRGRHFDGATISYDSSFGDHGRWSFD